MKPAAPIASHTTGRPHHLRRAASIVASIVASIAAPVALTVFLADASTALAIHPGRWVHSTEADFEPGQTDSTVVTNLGDVKLATGTTEVGKMPEQASVIYDFQPTADGAVYIAAGPEAKLLRRNGDKIDELASLKDEQVFCLDLFNGRVLAGVSGDKTSRLATLDEKGKLTTLAELPDVRYVWDVVVVGKKIYVATGIDGKLFEVDTTPADKPKVTELLDAAQANLLCLGRDAKGRLYAGSDTDGLVYRLTPNAKGGYDSFVLYDAAEPEIGALLVTADGTVYAGTADAEQARPGRLEKAVAAETGRPQPQPGDVPKPGDLPNVPPKPEPKAGDIPAPSADDKPAPDADDKPAPAPQPKAAPKAAAPNDAPAPAPAPAAQQPAAAPAEPAEPTPEQRDQLRQEIRRRLEEARRTGALQAGPMILPTRRSTGSTSGPTGRRSSSSGPTKQGNAIYRIDPTGFVDEVFRESVMVLRLIDDNGTLLVATGNEGQLFRVNPDAGETTLIVDLEPQQIPAMLRGPGGAIMLGTANPANLVLLDAGRAKAGTYTSKVLDAAQISLWGKLNVVADVPAGAALAVETRSGNVEDPDQAAWSAWASAAQFKHDPAVDALTPRTVTIPSPPARFLQYRLSFTGDGAATAVAGHVDIAYVTPNMKPQIKSIKAEYANAPRTGSSGSSPPGPPRPSSSSSRRGAGSDDGPQPMVQINVEWEAADPNSDTLNYTLEYRAADSDKWLPLADDLDQNRFEWKTQRVPDGRYVIRVTASDGPDNPPGMLKTATRRSDPVLVDNTPPTLQKVAVKIDDGTVVITATAVDRLSPIQNIQYAIDSTDDWQPVLPDDLIYDSTSEQFTVKIGDLAPGPHVVTHRVFDGQANAHYQAIQVQIK